MDMATLDSEYIHRLALVAGRIDSGVAITDHAGNIEWTNDALLDLSRWHATAIQGANLCDLLNQDPYSRSSSALLRRHFAEGQAFRLEYEAARHEQPELAPNYWIELDAIRLQDDSETGTLFMCLFSDISERKRRERQRELEHELLQALMENIPISLFVIEPHSLRLIAINRYAESEFGLCRMDVIGRTISQAMGRKVADLTLPDMQEAIDTQLTIERDFKLQTQHQLRIINTRYFSLRNSDGSPRLLISLANDITEEYQHARELQRARDLAEAANEAKNQFLAKMSHEIRTPMNGVLGMAELLLATTLNDQQKQFAQAITRSGENLLEIINDVLDFSKIETKRLDIIPTTFPLRELLEDTLNRMAPRAQEKGLELSLYEDIGVPTKIDTDALRLRQILTHLVANAIKFTESGEVVVDVRLAAPRVATTLPMSSNQVTLEFTVRDTGIGISPQILPSLFGAFTQAHNGLARRYGGTGLGLAISKHLIELMGGEIEVHSTLGKGSEFSFRIPIITQPTIHGLSAPHLAVDARHPEPTTYSARKLLSSKDAGYQWFTTPPNGLPPAVSSTLLSPTCPAKQNIISHASIEPAILIVEDNRVNQEVICHMLKKLGCRLEVAESATTGLRKLCEQRFDLILMDIQMPEMDGIEALTIFRQGPSPIYPFINPVQLPIIAVTANALASDEERFLKIGFDAYLSKPFRQQQLLALIQRYLTAQASLSHTLKPAGILSTPHATSQQHPSRPDLAEPPTHHNMQVLDPEALKQLTALDPHGTNKLVERVFKAFIDSAHKLQVTLIEAQESQNLSSIGHIVHTLKSSSASIGALKLSQLCADIEKMVRQGSAENYAVHLEILKVEIERVVESLEVLLENQL